jgi:hypothetical protein
MVKGATPPYGPEWECQRLWPGMPFGLGSS